MSKVLPIHKAIVVVEDDNYLNRDHNAEGNYKF